MVLTAAAPTSRRKKMTSLREAAEQAIEGDIVQVDPSVKMFGGCMVTVS